MFFHLVSPAGALCKAEELGILTENPNLVDCPECSKRIRQAAIKLYKRRKKILDYAIIYKVLSDNTTKANTSDEDWESYQVRARELEEEIKEFNPSTAEESYIMSLLAEELEREYERN